MGTIDLLIAWVLVTSGLLTSAIRDACPHPYRHIMIGTRNTAYVDKCTCQLQGQSFRYPDDTRCQTWEPGYTDEMTWKLGYCKNGTCVLRSLPVGCLEYLPPEGHVPIGCIFTCKNGAEFAYMPRGSECKHVTNIGKMQITTTCKPWGKGTICRTEEEMKVMLRDSYCDTSMPNTLCSKQWMKAEEQ